MLDVGLVCISVLAFTNSPWSSHKFVRYGAFSILGLELVDIYRFLSRGTRHIAVINSNSSFFLLLLHVILSS